MKKKKVTMDQIYKSGKYFGKVVVIAGGDIYFTKLGNDFGKLINKARKEHPRAIPEVAHILPKNTLLIV